MKHFIRKYKSEIALGICALTAGAMSFFITLNISSKLKENNEISASQNIVAQKTDIKLSGEDAILNSENKMNENVNKISENENLKTIVLFEEKEEEKKNEKILDNEAEYQIKEGSAFEDISEVLNEEIIIETTSNNVEKEEKKIFEFVMPISGDIILDFAKDKLVYSETLEEWIIHEGIDIKNEAGTPVKASEDGIVESMKMDPRYGNTIILKHDDVYKTVYSNLSTLDKVYVGMNVKKGDIISSVGEGFGFECKEGPHVHFELIENGININPNKKR